jgi:hypothetical protein
MTTYTKPQLRERIKDRITAGGKGGNPGQWSARKAQLVALAYKSAGGGYRGKRGDGQKSLSQWTREKWGTKSGKPSTQGPKATGERYLPKAKRDAMSAKDYAATTAKKRRDTAAGVQYSAQPKSRSRAVEIALKAARGK